MCVICLEILKNKMTLNEAKANVGELIGLESTDEEFEHYSDLLEAIENDDTDALNEVLDEKA